MEQTEISDVEHLKNRVYVENPRSLHMKRVPRRTKEEFTAWADEEFEGDYGMAMKWLWEQRVEFSQVADAIGELTARVATLEQRMAEVKTAQQEDDGVRRMADGSMRRVRKKVE